QRPLPAGTPVPRLGLLPLGTGNSFLRDLGIHDLNAALTAVEGGETTRVDVVHAQTHPSAADPAGAPGAARRSGDFVYLNLLGVGFASDVGDLTNRRFKALGPAGYAAATLVEVLRLRHRVWPLRVDDGPPDAD